MLAKSLISVCMIGLLYILSACSSPPKRVAYKDKFPAPCTEQWYVEIEKEVNLTDPDTTRPPPGSIQWKNALDEKYSISARTGTLTGDLEWCHQVHQNLIGY